MSGSLVCSSPKVTRVFKLAGLVDLNYNAASQTLMDNLVLCLIGLHADLTNRAWSRRLVASR